jgi:hypothetical protein
VRLELKEREHERKPDKEEPVKIVRVQAMENN